MNYEIVSSRKAIELEERVEQMMLSGWKLQGGLCIYLNPLGQPTFSQAMILE